MGLRPAVDIPALGERSLSRAKRQAKVTPVTEIAFLISHYARREADRLACKTWNERMLGFRGPAQPSPMLGDALNGGYRYLEVRCAGCDLHST